MSMGLEYKFHVIQPESGSHIISFQKLHTLGKHRINIYYQIDMVIRTNTGERTKYKIEVFNRVNYQKLDEIFKNCRNNV